MKRTTTVLALLLVALTIVAGPITPKKAAATAQAFMNTHPRIEGDAVLSYQSARAEGKGNYYYIYSTPSSEGFVIVSGDDRTESILGYSDEGTFDANHIPANMALWLRTYEAAMDKMDREETAVSQAYTPPTEAIAPLLTTKWNQDYPFNLLCPNNCPTGCVATAMAQMMYYHRWPQGPTSALPGYTTYSNKYERPDLPAITFEWDKMRNNYNYGSTEESREAVAQLMLYAGQAVQMDYTPSGSGAQTFILPWIISQDFGYSNSAWVADRSDFSMGEWDELLLNELRAQRPVLYTGYTCNWEGHAFVCDGYDGAGMYHINWGWGGYCDGYYRISLLDPDGSGIGGSSTSDRFSISQSAIIGWSVDEVETNHPDIRVLSALERPSVKQAHFTRSDASQDFTGISIHQWIANSTGQGYNSNSGYGLFQGDEMIAVLHSQSVHLWPTQSFEQAPTLSFGAGLANGDYEICPISANIDNNQWMKDRGADRHFIRAHIDDNELVLTPVPLADFEVNEVSINGSKMTINLTNPHEEFNGTVRLYTDEEYIAEEQVAIAAGETCNIYLYLSKDHPLTNADIFYLSVDQYDDNYFYSNGSNVGAELENEIEILNMKESDGDNIAYGGKLFYNINVSNVGSGTYHYTLDINLRDITRDKTSNNKRFIADIAPGETLTIPMQAIITKNMFGKIFQIEIAHKAGKETVTTISPSFKCSKGAVLWMENGEMSTLAASSTITIPENVVAAELSAAYTTNVIANSNPNTIYLLGEEVPPGLVGHNVVSAQGMTGKLDLYDGYPYFVPTAIQTDAIHYHRTARVEDSGWSMLMLPFAPTAIRTATGESVTWPTTSLSGNSDFYLFQPKQVTQEGIVLDAVSEMNGVLPYFISIREKYQGQELVFSLQEKSTLPPTEETNYRHTLDAGSSFQGTYMEEHPTEVFTMEGLQMVFSNAPVTVPPFRSYLNAIVDQETLPLIFPFNVNTGIATVENCAAKNNGYIYNMQGQRMGATSDLPSMPHGIYIINGKKTTH